DSFATSLFVYDHTEIEGLDEPAKNTPSGKYVVPTEHKFEPFTEDRERTAYNVSLQWAPASGAGNFYVDLNSTERDGGQEAYSILHVSGTPVATADTYEDANGALNNYRMEGNVVAIPKTWSSSGSGILSGGWYPAERYGGQAAYSILHVSGTPVATADTYEDANGALNNYRMEGNVVAIPKTWSSFRSTDSFSNAIGGEWNFTDN